MNRSRAAEANKHTLDVCQALIARGGLIKHVVHRGNSCLYVCLPALFELYLQNHGVFIPSFTAYVRSLSSDLAQTDRIHPQRFPPHFQKAAAVTFKWPAERRDLPAAEELAQLLHLNDQIEQQPQQEAVSGTESGKISWGHRIQAKPRSNQQQQQQQQAVAGAVAGGKDAGAAAAADGVAGMDAHWCVVDGDAPAAATAAALDVSQPGAAGADQAVKQQNGQPGSTSSSSSSLLEGQPQQQRKRSPSAAAAGAAPGAAAAADGAAAVVQESPFIAKRQRDDTPEQQQQQQQQEEQRPAKLLKQLPAAADSPGNANMLTFPLSSVALVTQQQQQQQSPTQRQQTPKQQQALGPGSHLLNKHTPPKNHAPQQQQQQQQQHKVGQLLPPKARPLPAGMHVHKLLQLQQPPTWLQPYQLPPLPPQQQQQQQLLQPPPASRPVVKRLPAGMRVGNMSHQGRLQLLTWLLKGRPDRIQQMKQQQQAAAAAGADGFPAKQQQKQEEPGKTAQQQQQQLLSASQVQLLQASLRKRQQELTQQQQQQQGSALRNGRLSSAGLTDVKQEEGLAAAPHSSPAEQQQQQQDEEEDCVQRASTTEAQQEVERLQQELQQLQDMLLNQGQGQGQGQSEMQQPNAAAPAAQQQQRKRAAADDCAVQPPPKQQQQQQQGKQKQARVGSGRVFHHSLLSAAEVAEVQALLSAMCVLVGAAGAQQLVAGIDVQLAAGSSSKEQQQQQQQKRHAAGCDCSGLQCMCSPAEDAVEQQQQQQQQQQQAGGMNRDVLLALRSLALAFGQQQQGLRVPTLQDLVQDVPCLLGGTSALDGQQLLCLNESQLQGFFAAVLDSELQRAVHAARQQQQQKAQEVSGSAAQQQQKQQQLAAQLMAAYKAGRGEVVLRPRTLMLVTGQRLMAAAQQVPQLPPLQQTPLAAAVAGCLAEREVQLLHIRQQDAAVTGLHLLNAFILRSKFDQRLAGKRQLALDMPGQCAVLAAAAGTCSQLRVSTVPAAVLAFPLLQEQQMASAAAEEAGSGDAVLSSWLFVAPELAAWQQLVEQLQELKSRQQQQQQQQSGRRPATLQQCKAQAEELLLGLQLQPQDLAWLQQQLNQARPAQPAPAAAAAVKQEPMPDADAAAAAAAAGGGASSVPQQQVAVLLQQQAGQAVQVKPGWLHVAVNHAANVKVWMEFVRPADVAACAAAQHALQQGADSSSSSGGGGQALGGAQLGPVLLTVLQQWCAYCHQQERLRLRQQQQQQQY
uniref:JmjC domain-containing protein n=1 Tax=Tetradesmus obliquus TaxID=3088 RepID=A0A383VCC4_TETOB|eukprot:jgi/Sobl393_1/5700/SZX62392.1